MRQRTLAAGLLALLPLFMGLKNVKVTRPVPAFFQTAGGPLTFAIAPVQMPQSLAESAAEGTIPDPTVVLPTVIADYAAKHTDHLRVVDAGNETPQAMLHLRVC